ncbi:MAG: lysophospholipid acyltransferase family protein [Oricola sp.]
MTPADRPAGPGRAIAAWLTGTAISILLALWAMTWRKDIRDLEKLDRLTAKGQHIVAVFWHGKYFSLLALAGGRDVTVLTTRSFRGDVIARICRWFGYRPIQIAHGVETHALSHLEADLTGHGAMLAAIAIDGPRGPAHHPKGGALRIASDLGFRLVPVSVSGSPKHVVRKRWDHHEIPLPFAKVRIAVGEPLDVPRGLLPESLPEWQDRLRDRIEAIDPARP